MEDAADPNRRVSNWLSRFNSATGAGGPEAVSRLFAERCFWRDILSLTWNIKTAEGRQDIAAMLGATLPHSGLGKFEPAGDAWEADGRTESFVRFETSVSRGIGHLRLDGAHAETLLTVMDELKGHEESKGPTRPTGIVHGAVAGRKSWLEERNEECGGFGRDRQPYAVIVGGGQAGIALAARLRQLSVPAVVLERNARPGDSWRNRYRTLVLHDPVWYDHLPYLPFPEHWPVFTPKDKMGDWLESYARAMELCYWGSATCMRAEYDESASEWIVSADRSGSPLTLRPKQLVLCTGAYGPPRIPNVPGLEAFEGCAIHSSAYQDGRHWRGKRCAVIGSNTSAHDICADLWESGAESVTMVQRSPSTVASSNAVMEVVFSDLYSERALRNGITTEKADLMFASLPFALLEERMASVAKRMEELDQDLLARLGTAGFLLDNGVDGTGLIMKAFRTGSGYYIDVGCSELIADGRIGLRAGVEPKRFAGGTLELTDGSAIPADLVVFATGYHTMQRTIAELVSEDVAERVGHCWGYGSGTPGDPGPWEGEMRNLWKPTAQEGLWLHGGNLHLSRFFSKFVALQIKARMEGLQTPVHGGPRICI